MIMFGKSSCREETVSPEHKALAEAVLEAAKSSLEDYRHQVRRKYLDSLGSHTRSGSDLTQG